MSEILTICIIDANEQSALHIRDLLKEIRLVQVVGESKDIRDSVRLLRQTEARILILDLDPLADKILEYAEKITTQFPDTTIIVISEKNQPELILKAMRAGAREFLTKPLNKESFLEAIFSISKTYLQKKAGDSRPQKIISVFGVKGGVGSTTIATNLGVNLSSHSSKSVLLLDLNFQLGNSSLLMNVVPNYSIIDIIHNINELDPDVLKSSLPRHKSGLQILTGPNKPEEADTITPRHFDRVLSLLKMAFDYIIIDSSKVLDEITLKTLDESNQIIVVFEYNLLSIYNIRRCLDIFERMGYDHEKVLLLVNRYDDGSGLAFQEFKKTVKYPLFWKIPNQDYTSVIRSMNKGIPLSQLNPKSKLSQSFLKLAGHLNGGVNPEHAPDKNKERLSFVKKLFSKK